MGDPQRKKSSPWVDTFSPWWMMLSWQSHFRNGNLGTNGLVLFIKIPFKREKKSQNPKDCIWNQQNLAVLICSLGSQENLFALCPYGCDIKVLEVLEAILTCVTCYWEVHTGGWVCSLFAKWSIFLCPTGWNWDLCASGGLLRWAEVSELLSECSVQCQAQATSVYPQTAFHHSLPYPGEKMINTY